MSAARSTVGYVAVADEAAEDALGGEGVQPLGAQAPAECRAASCRRRAALAAALLAPLAAAGAWMCPRGRRPTAPAELRAGVVQLDAEDPPVFLETTFGARGCPSGTITVPNSARCRQYAATVQNQGLCAKHNGYGPDCDGPVEGRAPWCAARPLGCWQSRNGCTYFKESGTDEPQLDVRPVCEVVGRGPPSPDSLFCISLLATAADHKLLSMQLSEGLGVFACDNHTVYSDEIAELAPGVNTSAMHIDTTCRQRVPSMECLNVQIFLEVWKHVLQTGWFRDYAWTLKVDSDAVFLAHRARSALSGLWDPPRGIYVANCPRGDVFDLHGPLEIFSRNALENYGKGLHLCLDGPNGLHYDNWNEAYFMDQCLQKLGVYRRLDGDVLREQHCGDSSEADAQIDQGACSSRRYVSFYPFQEETAYRDCARAAGQAG